MVTPGDPRGVGPEVAVRAVARFTQDHPTADIVFMGPDGPVDSEAFGALAVRARTTPPSNPPSDETSSPSNDASPPSHHASAAAGRLAARSIERAVEAALAGTAHAVVTAPLHKPSLHAAGWPVPGQTEMLASLTGTEQVGMLMAAEQTRIGPPLRVLLATTHLPLRDVCEAVTFELLVRQIGLLDEALRRDWGFEEPRIGVCGLNPHASDGGLFGDEEERVFEPAIEDARNRGVVVEGPWPADTVFARALDGAYDAVVAPYHDVGMAAFKTVSFRLGVNVTLGLPFVRTSPDHGTAFDIAGTNTADPRSMLEALRLAYRLANERFDSARADV